MDNTYSTLLHRIINCGHIRETRNGQTYSHFSNHLEFDLKSSFPILSTKKVYWKGIVEELLWFLRGNTDNKLLIDKGVKIWSGNAKEDGECGPIYGFQWRHYNAPYSGCNASYINQGIDQLAECIRLIRDEPTSRRILLSAWNPCQMDEMCLPPCHVSYQFYITPDGISCMMYQRSADVFLGLPFNIASTALLTHIIGAITGYKPNKVSIVIGDAHIYVEHINQVYEQLSRKALDNRGDIPEVELTGGFIKKAHGFNISNFSSEDLDKFFNNLVFEDFTLVNYRPQSEIKAKMIV